MTKFCESCHTPNVDRARYCRGCAGRFSGIRTAATTFRSTVPDWKSERPSLRATMPADDILAVRRSTVVREQPDRALPAPNAPVMLSMVVIVALSAAFVAWYWNRAPDRTHPSAPMASAQAAEPVESRHESAMPALPPVAKRADPAPETEPLRKQEARTGLPAETLLPIPAPAEARVASIALPQDPPPVEASPTAAAQQHNEVASSPPPKSKVARQATRKPAPGRPAPNAISVAEVRPVEVPRFDSMPLPRLSAQSQAAAGPAVGSMTRCDRLNPFGEALCMDPR